MKSDRTSTSALTALKTLQENASQFFEALTSKYKKNMRCAKGCSACCHVSLEIFESEAWRIFEYFKELNQSDRKALADQLTRALQHAEERTSIQGIDPAGVPRAPCVFLADKACSIYEARPMICRTQGAPLQWKNTDEKDNIKLMADVCPLNFTEENSLPPPAEFLDLDKLTTLQALAEQEWRRRHALSSLDQTNSESQLSGLQLWNSMKTSQGRVPLQSLAQFLANSEATLRQQTP